MKKYAIEDQIEESKNISLFRNHSQFAKFESFLGTADTNINFDSLFVMSFLRFNNYFYESGLVLIENSSVFKIIFVLKSNSEYYFLCELYETKGFERSLNSIEIQPYCPEQQLAFIKLSDLSHSQSFSNRICNNKTYVIAENLAVFRSPIA